MQPMNESWASWAYEMVVGGASQVHGMVAEGASQAYGMVAGGATQLYETGFGTQPPKEGRLVTRNGEKIICPIRPGINLKGKCQNCYEIVAMNLGRDSSHPRNDYEWNKYPELDPDLKTGIPPFGKFEVMKRCPSCEKMASLAIQWVIVSECMYEVTFGLPKKTKTVGEDCFDQYEIDLHKELRIQIKI